MSKDSFFAFVDGEVKAYCGACREKTPEKKFAWRGSQGYGNYDLNCCYCNSVIHKRQFIGDTPTEE